MISVPQETVYSLRRNSKTGNPGDLSLTHQTEFLTEVGTLSDHFTSLVLEWRAAQSFVVSIGLDSTEENGFRRVTSPFRKNSHVATDSRLGCWFSEAVEVYGT